jgi:hypothetical protein
MTASVGAVYMSTAKKNIFYGGKILPHDAVVACND